MIVVHVRCLSPHSLGSLASSCRAQAASAMLAPRPVPAEPPRPCASNATASVQGGSSITVIGGRHAATSSQSPLARERGALQGRQASRITPASTVLRLRVQVCLCSQIKSATLLSTRMSYGPII